MSEPVSFDAGSSAVRPEDPRGLAGRVHWGEARALFVALGGTSYAAIKVPKNSVGSKQLKKNAVTGSKIKNGAVTAAKINPSGLTVPNATNATNTTNATNATNATTRSESASAA